MKKVLLLGASGSIGGQSLDVMRQYPDRFVLTGFSVGARTAVIKPLIAANPGLKWIYLRDPLLAKRLMKEHPAITFFSGDSGLQKLVKTCDFDICVDALMGFVGLEPALITLKRNKILCLANKEALVVGGTLITSLIRHHKGKLYPIDSEHVGLAKCLSRARPETIDELIITASGGALRKTPREALAGVTPAEALKHPTWKMGEKITIDCATMMNKGFELIEAAYLFNTPPEKIKILMHDESEVHALVRLKDGSYLVDYGKPDMRVPIKWALFEGDTDFELKHVKNLSELKGCHFRDFDPKRYPAVGLALKAYEEGGTKLAVLNAADEVAVDKFLKGYISFPDIVKVIEEVLKRHVPIPRPSLREIRIVDRVTRTIAEVVALKK